MVAYVTVPFGGFQQAIGQGLVAHLMVVNHFVRKRTMAALLDSGRYKKLSLAYAGYIACLAEGDRTPGELSTRLGISKQACSKTLRELEGAGFVAHRDNPRDSRSRLLSLTARGRQLLEDGIAATEAALGELSRTVGRERLDRLVAGLDRLRREFGVELPGYLALEPTEPAEPPTRPGQINVLFTVLSDHFQQRLRADVLARGFPVVKPSCGQVLGLISREGRQIQYIASVLGVSKQAIAASAAELEEQGYITRQPDPRDRRQLTLALSPLGTSLLEQAVACAEALQASIRHSLGDEEYRQLEAILEAMYLQVAEDLDGSNLLPAKIQYFSEYLLEELGVAGARALAMQLMEITRGKP